MAEKQLMKGNEAIAEAAIRAGCDGYFGYPITPQSEILEYLMGARTEERTGMVVLQAESEIAAINMVYGGASTGKKVMTSSSSPGISLMQETISYLAGAELPALIVNVVRGGPGLGTIQPSQADYFQSVKGGGHGDYKLIALAPDSVQEMCDFVKLGFDLAFKYRNPAIILTDGVIGQMMETVKFFDQIPRTECDRTWNVTGKPNGKTRNTVTSLELDSAKQEERNEHIQAKYKELELREIRYEFYGAEDFEYLIVSYGSSARICKKTIDFALKKKLKIGLLRPITLFPFPHEKINQLSNLSHKIFCIEMSAGQLVEDVRLAVNGKCPVLHFGRMGGLVHSPLEVLEFIESNL